MADEKKNISPESEKRSDAPKEKKTEPIKDTLLRRSSRFPVRRRLHGGSCTEKKTIPTPKVIAFCTAKRRLR